jgi:threonine dehydrogenase-like Zn-dependent dehydrogenase
VRVPVLKGPRKIEWKDKPKPGVGPAEILVKVEYCGICGSDAHGYDEGKVIPAGTVLGHEFSGVVAETGKTVQSFKPGDAVVVKPFADPEETTAGSQKPILTIEQLLETAIGISPKQDGAFAEYVSIPYPDVMAFHLPRNVSFTEGALAEPLAVSLHGVRLSRLKPGARAVVIGGGMIGLGVIQFLRLGGAGRIVVLEVSSEKGRIAEKLGADAVLNPLAAPGNTKEEVLNLTDGIGADMVFECSGAPSALQNSVGYVRRGGQVIVVGLHGTEVPFDFFWMLHWEVEMKGSMAYHYDEFKYVVEFLEKGRLHTEPLITDTIRLDELEEKGLKRMISSRDVVKILVKP